MDRSRMRTTYELLSPGTYIVGIALLIIFAAASPVDGGKVDELNHAGVEITANRIELIESRVEAGGGAALKSGAFSLTGDMIVYDLEYDLIRAEGNLVLIWEGKKFAAGALSYDMQTEELTLSQAEGEVDTLNVSGEKLSAVGESYMLEGGLVTPCSREDPHYHLTADRVEIRPGKSLTAHGSRIWIAGYPILGLPRYTVPLDREQLSLLPEIGFTDQKGYYLHFQHGYRVSDALWLPLALELSSRRGYEAEIGFDYEQGGTGIFGRFGRRMGNSWQAEVALEQELLANLDGRAEYTRDYEGKVTGEGRLELSLRDDLDLELYSLYRPDLSETWGGREWALGTRAAYRPGPWMLDVGYVEREEVESEVFVSRRPEVRFEVVPTEVDLGLPTAIVVSGGLGYADLEELNRGREDRIEFDAGLDSRTLVFGGLDLGMALGGALRSYSGGELQGKADLAGRVGIPLAAGMLDLSYYRTESGGETPFDFDRWDAKEKVAISLDLAPSASRVHSFGLEAGLDLKGETEGDLDLILLFRDAPDTRYPHWDLSTGGTYAAGGFQEAKVALERVYDCFVVHGEYVRDFAEDEHSLEFGIRVMGW